MAIQGGVSTFDNTYDDFMYAFDDILGKGGQIMDKIGQAKNLFGDADKQNLINEPQMYLGYDDGRNNYTTSGYEPRQGQIKNDTIVAKEKQNALIKWLVGIISLIAVVLGIGAAFGDKV